MGWKKLHEHYNSQDWIQKPSIFAEEVFQYFPSGGRILEIGAGIGQDSRFFHDKGFEVLSTDFSPDAVGMNLERSQTHLSKGRYNSTVLDISLPTGFPSESFDGIYAHLSLHYFSTEQSLMITRELSRIIKPEGIIAILLNSTSDPEYGTGEYIEDDYFLFGSIKKRFFSLETTGDLFGSIFHTILLDSAGETYKDGAKGIHNLIRFIGKRPL